MDDRYFDMYPLFNHLSGMTALTSTRAFFDDGIQVRNLTDSVFKMLNLETERAVWPVQIHSGNVHFTRNPGAVPDCDGVITDRDDLILLLRTADCVPVFISDKAGKLWGLIHAGWRGLRKKIIITTAGIMKEKGISGKDLIAVTGPSICKDCYEVGRDVADYFPGHVMDIHGRRTLDLQGIIREQLILSDIPKKNILLTNRCTLCQTQRYVSYRFNKTRYRLLSLLRK